MGCKSDKDVIKRIQQEDKEAYQFMGLVAGVICDQSFGSAKGHIHPLEDCYVTESRIMQKALSRKGRTPYSQRGVRGVDKRMEL